MYQHDVRRRGRANLTSAADQPGLIAPPPSGEDGYVYPAGTASSVSELARDTHNIRFLRQVIRLGSVDLRNMSTTS